MPGERSGFSGHAFHQITITADRVDVEIEEVEPRLIVIRGQPFAGDGHAHAVRHALAQRTGGGFNAGGEMRFRVAWRSAIELAKTLELVHRDGEFVGHLTAVIYLLYANQVQ